MVGFNPKIKTTPPVSGAAPVSKKGDVSQGFVVTADLTELSTSWNEENSANVLATQSLSKKELNATRGPVDLPVSKKARKQADSLFKSKGFKAQLPYRAPATTAMGPSRPV